MGDYTFLQLSDYIRIAIKQGELIHLSADRPFQSTHRIRSDHVIEHPVSRKQLFAKHRDPLSERGRLGGNIVRPRRKHDSIPLLRPLTHPAQGRHGFFPDHQKPAENLELLDILGQIPGSQALVDFLMTREVVELLDPSFYIVPRDPLPIHDGLHIHTILRRFIGSDSLV